MNSRGIQSFQTSKLFDLWSKYGIPDDVVRIMLKARDNGFSSNVFEAGEQGSVVLDVWTPWSSELASRLRAVGFRDSYMDQAVAETDPQEQMMTWQKENPSLVKSPRLFKLVRKHDVSGVSGEGHVADGVRWHDGTVAVRWRTEHRSTVIYDSVETVEKIHGHGGSTTIEWYGDIREGASCK